MSRIELKEEELFYRNSSRKYFFRRIVFLLWNLENNWKKYFFNFILYKRKSKFFLRSKIFLFIFFTYNILKIFTAFVVDFIFL